MPPSKHVDFNTLEVPTTPVLVLLRRALERNLDVMQGRCRAAGVRLRAHGKMHKFSTTPFSWRKPAVHGVDGPSTRAG
ncbi:MAG TPA: hypothetical protein VII35_00330 [Steroidobacteraceae bacterium]